QFRLPHRAAPGPEPPDPADGRRLRLPRDPAAPRAHRQRATGPAQARPVAQPQPRVAAGAAAALDRLVSPARLSPPAGVRHRGAGLLPPRRAAATAADPGTPLPG